MDDSSCKVGCEGLYADIDFVKSTSREHSNDSLATLIKEYEKYKRSQIDKQLDWWSIKLLSILKSSEGILHILYTGNDNNRQ